MATVLSIGPDLQRQIDHILQPDGEGAFAEDDVDLDFARGGLIVGQRTTSPAQSHGVFLARTPPQGDDDANPEQSPSSGGLDVQWSSEHSTQISRLLPGGLEVVGVVLVGDEIDPDSKVVREQVGSIFHHISSSQITKTGEERTFHLLHISQPEGECRFINWGSAGFGGPWRPVKEDKVPFDEWISIRSSFILDYPAVFGAEGDSMLLKSKMEVVVEKLKADVFGSSILFGGAVLPHQVLEHVRSEGSQEEEEECCRDKGKGDYHQGGQAAERRRSKMVASIVLDEDVGDNLLSGSENLSFAAGCRMKLNGKLAVRVYMHPKATVGEASWAVKEDVIRSVTTRIDMHCDALVGEEAKGIDLDASNSDPPLTVHEPPRRCLVGLPFSKPGTICISDYLFPGETTYDSAESVFELFGFHPSLEKIDDELEICVTMKNLGVNVDGEFQKEEGGRAHQDSLTKEDLEEPFFPIGKLIALAIILAILIFILHSYLGYRQEQERKHSLRQDYALHDEHIEL